MVSPLSQLRERVLSGAKRVRVRLLSVGAIVSISLASSALVLANDFAALVGGLAGDSFAEKERSVAALGALGDPRAIAILQALADGRLFIGDDRRAVVTTTEGGTTKFRDAVTGADIASPGQPSFSRVIVNNRL